jgi:tetratricopeptide (TPR) repeat protein
VTELIVACVVVVLIAFVVGGRRRAAQRTRDRPSRFAESATDAPRSVSTESPSLVFDARPEAAAAAAASPQSTADARDDEAFLRAEPIPRPRMFVLSLDSRNFSMVETAMRSREEVALAGGYAGGMVRLTRADLEWAKSVIPLLDSADSAGGDERYEEALRLYKRVLALAPGADFVLMSVGTCLVQMGQPTRAIRWYERALEITPGNDRIRNNLEGARQAARAGG